MSLFRAIRAKCCSRTAGLSSGRVPASLPVSVCSACRGLVLHGRRRCLQLLLLSLPLLLLLLPLFIQCCVQPPHDWDHIFTSIFRRLTGAETGKKRTNDGSEVSRSPTCSVSCVHAARCLSIINFTCFFCQRYSTFSHGSLPQPGSPQAASLQQHEAAVPAETFKIKVVSPAQRYVKKVNGMYIGSCLFFIFHKGQSNVVSSVSTRYTQGYYAMGL